MLEYINLPVVLQVLIPIIAAAQTTENLLEMKIQGHHPTLIES